MFLVFILSLLNSVFAIKILVNNGTADYVVRAVV